MNMKLKTLAALMLGGSLVACGGSSNDGDAGSDPREGDDVTCVDNAFQDKCIILPRVTEIDITNEPVPLHETFAVQGAGNQAGQFFSTDYKSLNTALENDQYEDDYPSFYYPTCCFWETDETTGEPTGNLIEDLDERLFVGTDAEGVGYLAMSSSRWTVAQLQPDLVTDAESDDNDAKSKTTDAPVASSWGELDLSVPYRVSFCLKDSGRAGIGTGGNLELYVDNNSGGNQGQSIHGNQSLLLRTAVLDLEAGNRLVVDVPGDVRVQNNDGEEVNLLGTTAEVYGTEISFLQFRVSSGGYAVISDLMVEHQSNLASSYMPCTADDTLFEPEALSGVAFAGLPHSVNFNVSEDDFFGGGESASFVAFPDSLTTPFYAPISGGSRTLLEEGTIRFGNAYWSIGNRGGATTSEDTVDDLTGGLDLSEPYRVTIEIASLTNPEEAGAQLQVFVDNSTSGASNSIWGSDSRLVQFEHQELETGELIINVPGDVTLNGTVIGTVDEHFGTERSFLMFRCPGNCGNAEEGNDLGVAFSGLLIEQQDDGSDPSALWPANTYVLAGGTIDAEGSVDTESETSITVTASGGKADSSDLNIFFAGRQVEMSDFAFTARIASIEGAVEDAENSYRFGIMAIAGLEPGGVMSNVAPWAAAGFFADAVEDNPVELFGSRSNMKADGSRTRSNIVDLEVGDYLRIEIYDDLDEPGKKRVRRCTSPDGVTWTQANSTNDFSATDETDSWYYGVWAAPGSNEITMEVDNISIEPYATSCENL
ncbi:hypothetical protein [Marinimicrobium sp. ARAG 43.8]|uniref:hypothetical protein n=1 Tax=Marinimicrobium sp. ARAG 43.8 TaxID=3418719 RepID=UPI003CF130F7